jgi:hypothetical protein
MEFQFCWIFSLGFKPVIDTDVGVKYGNIQDLLVNENQKFPSVDMGASAK